MTSHSSKVRLPLDVDNDERAAVLYSPFRGKNVNPVSWQSKMNFWQKLLEDTAIEKRWVTIDLNSLPHLFQRKGISPKCLPTVVEELQRVGKVKSIEDYKKPNSWVSWGFNALVKDPLVWGVSQMFGSPKKSSTVFVWPDVLKNVAEEILTHLQSHIQQGILVTILPYVKLEEMCSEFVSNKEHLDLIVNHLQMNKKIYVEQTDRFGVIVKVYNRDRSTLSPISGTDLKLFEIDEAYSKIEKEVNILSNRIEKLQSEAKSNVRNHKREMALLCLRKKKHLEKCIASKSSILHNLEEILSKIDEAETNQIVVQACEAGVQVLRQKNKELNIDKVESVMGEVQEAIQDSEEVNDAISSVGLETREESNTLLEEELAALLDETKSEEICDLDIPDLSALSLTNADFPEVPSHSPSSTKNSITVKETCRDMEDAVML